MAAAPGQHEPQLWSWIRSSWTVSRCRCQWRCQKHKIPKQEHFAYDLASNRTGNQNNSVTRAKLSGSATAGNVLTITTTDSGLSGGSSAVNYTVQSGDTLAVIATKLAEAIAVSTSLQSIGVTAAADGSILSIKSSSPNVTTYAATTSGGATASIAMAIPTTLWRMLWIGGTKTLAMF